MSCFSTKKTKADCVTCQKQADCGWCLDVDSCRHKSVCERYGRNGCSFQVNDPSCAPHNSGSTSKQRILTIVMNDKLWFCVRIDCGGCDLESKCNYCHVEVNGVSASACVQRANFGRNAPKRDCPPFWTKTSTSGGCSSMRLLKNFRYFIYFVFVFFFFV